MTFDQARRVAREQGDASELLALMPYAAFLGLRMEIGAGGSVLSRLPFKPALIGNPRRPALHGGVVAAFMEGAALLHLLLVLDENRVPKSIDFSIDYLRSAQPLDTLAVCAVERLGRRVAQVQIRCWQNEPDKPVALARAHFLLAADE
jgi:uncharacterized protein (TIGR00369 family)